MNKKIFVYTIAAVLVIGLVLVTMFPGMIYAMKDSGEDSSVVDKCAPGPGYTEESWREHMSHHPNVYAECLT